MITEKNIAHESQQNIAAVFQSQTQTISVIWKPDINTETKFLLEFLRLSINFWLPL